MLCAFADLATLPESLLFERGLPEVGALWVCVCVCVCVCVAFWFLAFALQNQ